jgi:hypothetical protein
MLLKDLFEAFRRSSEEFAELVGDFFENPTSRVPREMVPDAKTLRDGFNEYYQTLSVNEELSISPQYLNWVADQIEPETPQLTVLKEIYDFRKMMSSVA